MQHELLQLLFENVLSGKKLLRLAFLIQNDKNFQLGFSELSKQYGVIGSRLIRGPSRFAEGAESNLLFP